MSIIDIMQTSEDNSVAVFIERAQDFKNAGYSVSAADQGKLIVANNGVAAFDPLDTITILSFGLEMPYGLEYYHDQGTSIYINAKWEIRELPAPNNTYDLDPSRTFVVWPNYDMSYNKPMDVSQASEIFQLKMIFDGIRISMLNVPEELEGETIPLRAYAKISHEIELQ